MATDGPAQFELVPGPGIVNQIWRNLAVFYSLYSQSNQFIFGWRSDRVAALRLVAVFSREADVDVLAGQMSLPIGYLQQKAFYAIGFDRDFLHISPLPFKPPHGRGRRLNHRQSPSYLCSFQGSP